ncbi:MAG: acyl-CoA carboxylase subunit beta [Deltaproteobacteria bacterium]|nr:acyl-CoA carboxylase subunit beta [Deltaproteobacteria bacterium]
MNEMEDRIKLLHEKEELARQGGGIEKIERHRRAGKLTARERLDYLLDAGSFREINMFAETQCFEFDMQKKKILGDGVVTGYGKVNGRQVFVFSQDATVFGGSCGRAHGQKICLMIRLARKTGSPIIGLNDTGGGRLQEGMDNVAGYGEMFFENSITSGVVPQISAIMGPCTGGGVYSPALTDFILQVEGTGQMFITGPAVVKEVMGEDVSFEKLGGAKVHSEFSGVTHLTAKNDRECLDMIKKLLSFLPQSNRDDPPVLATDDDPQRLCEKLTHLVPADQRKTYDMREVIREVVDAGDFFELHPRYAQNLIVGFARLAGRSVGIVANQPRVFAGSIDINAADKGSRFIRFCDAFNIPLIIFVDVPGYMPGVRQEYGGIIRHGAKMLYAWSESTVPKITCILRKSYGGAIPGMCCHEVGADQLLVWPTAEMAMMGAEPAVNILYKREIESAPDPEQVRKEKSDYYRNTFSTPYYSASKQLIDMVIEPKNTRRLMIDSLLMMKDKKIEQRPWRKHGVMPT